MTNNYVIGLMSGTSMDGIDASLVKTDGLNLLRTGYQIHSNYKKKTNKLLKILVFDFNKNKKNKLLLNSISELVTKDHLYAINQIIKISGITPDLIGFHGQTIFHNPANKESLQIGNGKLLANLSKIKVVSNFRDNDIIHGGEGAPIAPVYHKLLINKLKLDIPCCFLNIGGVSNLSYWDGNKLIGFDLGPGNGLMDIYCQEKLNIPFDKLGILASKGVPNFNIVSSFIKLPYFKKKYPKSLDRLEFLNFVRELQLSNYDPSEALATLLEMSVASIIEGVKILPSTPKKLVVMGGGQHNQYLFSRIKNSFSFAVSKADDVGIPGDFIEAELIAYLAARNIKNLPITFPNTTGVKTPCVGGIVHLV
jgi:anhydro-N-acetylmuramic acid kinase